MDLHQITRLRWKFLAILAVATAVPVLLYAYYPLKFFLDSLREIENQTVHSEFGDLEMLIRHERSFLEREAQSITFTLAAFDTLSQDSETALPVLESLDLPGSGEFDFLGWLSNQGELVPLREQAGSGLADSLNRRLARGNFPGECQETVSGLVDTSVEPFLVAISPVFRDRQEKQGCLVLGIGVRKRLLPQFELRNGKTIQIGPLEEGEEDALEAGIRIERPETASLVAMKTLPGLLEGERFSLRLSSERGLIGQIESNQTWYFLIFLGGLCLAGALGTGWAASAVLRPVHRLIKTMASIRGPDTYWIRAPVDRSDEIGFLAESFNRLMERLEKAQAELERAQKQALDSERLEAIHAMVITLAHEINNPLTYIQGQAELMIMEGNQGEEDRRSLEVIREMSLRIAEVLRNLQSLQRVEMTTYIDWQKMIKVGSTPLRDVRQQSGAEERDLVEEKVALPDKTPPGWGH
jgi:signal transduction histidine kinase